MRMRLHLLGNGCLQGYEMSNLQQWNIKMYINMYIPLVVIYDTIKLGLNIEVYSIFYQGILF